MEKKGTILLIDDNESEIRLIKEAYKDTKYNHELLPFNDGSTAFDYIQQNIGKIFIIICDVSMPGMNGTDLLEKINAKPKLKLQAIPFIFLSNSDNKRDIEKAYSLAAQGYFQKPMGHDEMVLLLQNIINYWHSARIPRDGE
jgi:CheY-like chemotaxis protein